MTKLKTCRVIPYGYTQPDPASKQLEEVEVELEALKNVSELILAGYLSYRDGAIWLEELTGRPITYSALRKRILKDDNETISTS